MVTVTATGTHTDDKSGAETKIERSAEYDFGDDLVAMRKIFGDELTHNHARQSMTISLQALMRTSAAKGDSEAETTKKVKEWKPSLSAPRKSKVDRGLELVSGMSAEDKAAFLTSLQEEAA